MMIQFGKAVCAVLASVSAAGAVVFKPQNEYQALSGSNTSFAVDLSPWFNNRAFGLKPNDSSFDGQGSESISLESYQ